MIEKQSTTLLLKKTGGEVRPMVRVSWKKSNTQKPNTGQGSAPLPRRKQKKSDLQGRPGTGIDPSTTKESSTRRLEDNKKRKKRHKDQKKK